MYIAEADLYMQTRLLVMLAMYKFRKRSLFFAFPYKLRATWEFTNPGHFIQHCPINGVPEFDVKRVKPPTGIPKSMLMPTRESSYALPCGAVAVLKPNEKEEKKKKKIRVPSNEMQSRNPQDLAMENYMMPMGPVAYNPYWNGTRPGVEGFIPSFDGPMPPFMGNGPGPLDVPFGLLPQDPFGVPNMMPPPPFPPQRAFYSALSY